MSSPDFSIVKKGPLTRGPGPLQEDLLGRDHREAAPDILVDGVTKLGPVPALNGPFAQARLRKFPHAGGGGDFGLVPVITELVLSDPLDTVLVGADHLPRRQQEVEILPIVLIELPPP